MDLLYFVNLCHEIWLAELKSKKARGGEGNTNRTVDTDQTDMWGPLVRTYEKEGRNLTCFKNRYRLHAVYISWPNVQ